MTLKWSSATDQLYAVSNSSPSLDLDFASNKSLLDNISGLPLVNHQRDASSGKSAGTYVGSDGLIKTSAVNYLKESNGLITGWLNSPANFIRTANYATAPDGTQTASRFQTQSGLVDPGFAAYTTRNYRAASIDYGVGAEVTISVYVKPITTTSTYPVVPPDGAPVQERDLFLWIQGEGGIGSFWFNLNTKETKTGSTAVDAGDGWWRFSCTGTTTFSDPNNHHFIYLSNRTATSSFDPYPDGNEEVYVWGMQSELGSTANTYVPTTTLATGAPRFDHDPVTGESLGLLIEESRTNSSLYSNDFGTSAGWTKISSTEPTITPNAVISPDGQTNASKIEIVDPNNTFFYRSVVAGFNSSTIYQYSIFLKAGTESNVSFRVFDGTNQAPTAIFNLTNGTHQVTSPSRIVASMEPWSNGWYRCFFRYVQTGSFALQEVNITTWTGYFYAYGFQAEANASFPTSYIPTSGSTVTRADDLVSILGADYTSVFGTDLGAGTVFTDVKVLGERGNPVGSSFSSFGTNSNNDFTYFTTYDNRTNIGVTTPSNANIERYRDLTGVRVKAAISWNDLEQPSDDQDNASHALDGTLYGGFQYRQINTPLNTGYDRFGIGRAIRPITAYYSINGHISRLAYYPYRLSDTILQEITS